MHRRLRALYDYHLLDRVRMVSKAEGITYTLGKAGRLWLGEAQRGGSPPRVNVRQIAHDLAVSEVATQFVLNLRQFDQNGNLYQFNWQGEAGARIIDKDKVVLEPDARARLSFKKGDQYQHYLIEVDMNTERAAAFKAKIERYHRAHNRPGLKDKNGQLPLVLVITPTPERTQVLTQLISESGGPLVWALNHLPALVEHGVYSQPWTMIYRGQATLERLQNAGNVFSRT
jgi:hypothetical protein